MAEGSNSRSENRGHGRKTAKKSCDDIDNGMQHTGCLKIIVF
jgi:hypothetical protein